MVEQAILNAKLIYKEHQRMYGPVFSGVKQAMKNTVDLFGIFNKDDRGIYILNGKMEEIVRGTGKNILLNNIVVCPGTLNYISIGKRRHIGRH